MVERTARTWSAAGWGVGGKDEALELTAANYGRDEWWLLLEREPQGV